MPALFGKMPSRDLRPSSGKNLLWDQMGKRVRVPRVSFHAERFERSAEMMTVASGAESGQVTTRIRQYRQLRRIVVGEGWIMQEG